MSDSQAVDLAHHFESYEQQRETASIGMWAFLVQEVMFFGGVFLAYILYRTRYHDAFVAGSSHLSIGWGTFNTVVLIGSSLTMALGVRAAQLGQARRIALWILATMALALVFLGVKAYEYAGKYDDGLIPGINWLAGQAPGMSIFYGLYFTMTGLHALHMVIGLGIMVFVALRALRGGYTRKNYIGVEVLGLYWHFVDLIWIFLFPLLYLLGRHAAH